MCLWRSEKIIVAAEVLKLSVQKQRLAFAKHGLSQDHNASDRTQSALEVGISRVIICTNYACAPDPQVFRVTRHCRRYRSVLATYMSFKCLIKLINILPLLIYGFLN